MRRVEFLAERKREAGFGARASWFAAGRSPRAASVGPKPLAEMLPGSLAPTWEFGTRVQQIAAPFTATASKHLR